MMKRYNLIFRLSFITYILFILAVPYVTTKIWANLFVLFFICALIYQFMYLFILRKKENKKFWEILILFLICGITAISVLLLIDYIDDYINGYTPTDFVGNSFGYTYYGMEAILKNQLKNILYMPYIIINSIILIIYKLKTRKLNNRKISE